MFLQLMFRRAGTLISLSFALTMTLVALDAPIARAQTSPLPKDVLALLDDISDIDKLRVLNPLKLTGDQIDRILAAIKKTQEAYDKRITDAAVPPMREIATEVKETRAKMLTSGGDVPKGLDDKVKRIQDDMIVRRRQADTSALKSLSDEIRGILKTDQIKTAASISRKFSESEGKPTAKGTDDQFFNYYVLGTFMVYPRIVPLLEDMKKASGGSASAAAPARAIALGPGRRP